MPVPSHSHPLPPSPLANPTASLLIRSGVTLGPDVLVQTESDCRPAPSYKTQTVMPVHVILKATAGIGSKATSKTPEAVHVLLGRGWGADFSHPSYYYDTL